MAQQAVSIGDRVRGIGTALATGANSAVQNFDFARSTFTIYQVPHGTVTTASLQLQGSTDGGTTWFNLGAASTAVTQTAWSITGVAATVVRVTVTITGGGNVDLYLAAV